MNLCTKASLEQQNVARVTFVHVQYSLWGHLHFSLGWFCAPVGSNWEWSADQQPEPDLNWKFGINDQQPEPDLNWKFGINDQQPEPDLNWKFGINDQQPEPDLNWKFGINDQQPEPDLNWKFGINVLLQMPHPLLCLQEGE